jgi:hypothetical protein
MMNKYFELDDSQWMLCRRYGLDKAASIPDRVYSACNLERTSLPVGSRLFPRKQSNRRSLVEANSIQGGRLSCCPAQESNRFTRFTGSKVNTTCNIYVNVVKFSEDKNEFSSSVEQAHPDI